MTKLLDFDTFYNAFIMAALWSSTDSDGTPLDSKYDSSDIDDDSAINLEALARVFWFRNSCYLEAIAKQNGKYAGNHGYTLAALAGHDLWLTMNGHGAGFWDRDFYSFQDDESAIKNHVTDYKDIFTKQAENIGGVDLMDGDDGKLYI